MTGVSAVGSAISTLRFQAEYQARVAKLHKDAVTMQGDLALQLLQSAALPQDTGQALNVQV